MVTPAIADKILSSAGRKKIVMEKDNFPAPDGAPYRCGVIFWPEIQRCESVATIAVTEEALDEYAMILEYVNDHNIRNIMPRVAGRLFCEIHYRVLSDLIRERNE